MEQEKKKNKKILIILIILILLIIIGIATMFILKKDIRKKVYVGTETLDIVNSSDLSQEEKQLYNSAIKRADDTILNGKTIQTIIDEEKNRQAQEKKELEEQKAREEEMKKVTEGSYSNLLNSLNINYKNYMNKIDTFTYTYNTNNINFEALRMYYDNVVTDFETFKNSISKYEEFQADSSEIITKVNEFLAEFDKATTKTNSADSVLNYFESTSNKFEVCYEMIFKKAYGKDVSEYMN